MSKGKLADEVRRGLMGTEGRYEHTRTGAPTGPWPVVGEAEHLFLGIEARTAKFNFFVGKDMQTLPGIALQLLYETIPADDSAGVQWRGEITTIPRDFDEVFPTLPVDTGLNCQVGINAGLGRIRGALGAILERESITLLGDIDAVNAMIEEEVAILVTVNVQDRKYKRTRGARAGEWVEKFVDYVNGAVISRPEVAINGPALESL